MSKTEMTVSRDKEVLWIIAGIPVIGVVGSLMHFVYDWSGQLLIVGIFAPVNESVWEHLKLIFWPTLVWWLIGYFRSIKIKRISASQWFSSCAVCLYVGPLFIMSFYYTYTGAFGIHSLLLDILSFFFGVAVAQITGLHIYRYAKTNRVDLICAWAAILFLMTAMILFTFNPPQIPLFQDPITGGYGI